MGRFAILDLDQNYEDKQAVLEAAYAVVADPNDWRGPIDTVIADHPKLLEMVTDAVIHFTAAVPVFSPATPGRVRVQAIGYREGPAGP